MNPTKVGGGLAPADPLQGHTMLSILIPTKNRYETLGPVVRTLLDHLPPTGVEIVVEDNSDRSAPEEVAQLLGSDERIVYHHDSVPLSIVENSTKAIEHSSGNYLCFIGDDDLVSPFITQAVELMKLRKARCLIYPPARYWWRSVSFAAETKYQKPGVFWLPVERSGEVRTLRSDAELARVLARGGVSYMDLPRLYHGIVERSVLEEIKRVSGVYLPGSSPDMAFSAALSLVLSEYLHIDYPISVFGASKVSGGGYTAEKRHFGRIEDQAHLPRDILKNWDPRLPQIWSEQIIYAQTIHEVMAAFGRNCTVSYPTLYASLAVYEPHIARLARREIRSYFLRNPISAVSFIGQLALKLAGRARVELRKRVGADLPFDLLEFDGVADVMECMSRLPFPRGEATAAVPANGPPRGARTGPAGVPLAQHPDPGPTS